MICISLFSLNMKAPEIALANSVVLPDHLARSFPVSSGQPFDVFGARDYNRAPNLRHGSALALSQEVS